MIFLFNATEQSNRKEILSTNGVGIRKYPYGVGGRDLDAYFIPHTKINFKVIIDDNIKATILMLLEQNMRILLWLWVSKIVLGYAIQYIEEKFNKLNFIT